MIERKNAYTMSKKEQDSFSIALKKLIADGTYGKLVAWHTDMTTYRMHAMNGPVGGLRFLGWHRAYLKNFENEIQKKDSSVTIPYLDWATLNSKAEVPAWLQSKDMKPTIDLSSTQATTRYKKVWVNQRNDKPDITKFAYSSRISSIENSNNYNEFTSLLEGYPHNSGHVILGSPMTSMASPADPIFWMHHAMVDKVWADWQKKNPKKHPKWVGVANGAQVLTPFTNKGSGVSYDDIKSISNAYLNYKYV